MELGVAGVAAPGAGFCTEAGAFPAEADPDVVAPALGFFPACSPEASSIGEPCLDSFGLALTFGNDPVSSATETPPSSMLRRRRRRGLSEPSLPAPRLPGAPSPSDFSFPARANNSATVNCLSSDMLFLPTPVLYRCDAESRLRAVPMGRFRVRRFLMLAY